MVCMPTVGDLLAALEGVAPRNLAFPDDPIGLQLGRKGDRVDSCVVSLDPSPSALAFAIQSKAQAIVSHHALIYNPLRSIAGDSAQVRSIRSAIENNLAVLVAHTNWDAAPGGINDTLSEKLGLSDVRSFGGDIDQKALKLVTFVPSDHRDRIIDALASVGCGTIGLYRRCAFYSSGHGTYEPQEGANPMIGQVGMRETTDELRVEMLVPSSAIQDALNALRDSHPYDEPAIDLYPLVAASESLPRCGKLASPMAFAELSKWVGDRLQTQVRAFGKPTTNVETIGVVGGSGGSYWLKARIAGCDALVTGEVRHHEAVEAAESGFCLIEAGHFATEQPGVVELSKRLGALLPDVKFHVYEPGAGVSGSSL